jgi:hypothetical protein
MVSFSLFLVNSLSTFNAEYTFSSEGGVVVSLDVIISIEDPPPLISILPEPRIDLPLIFLILTPLTSVSCFEATFLLIEAR